MYIPSEGGIVKRIKIRPMKKPPIVAIAALLAMLALCIIYAYNSVEDSDEMRLMILVLGFIVFLQYTILFSYDISWMKLFSSRGFKAFAVTLIAIIAGMIALNIIYSLDKIVYYILYTLMVAALVLVFFENRESEESQKT